MSEKWSNRITIGVSESPPKTFNHNRFLCKDRKTKLTKEEYNEFRSPDFKYCGETGERVYNPLRNATDEAIDRAIDIQEVADNAEEALAAMEHLKYKYKKLKAEIRETAENLANFIHSTEYKLTQMERDYQEDLQELRNSIE